MIRRFLPPAGVIALVLALAAGAVGCSSDHHATAPAIYSSIVITGPDTIAVGNSALFQALVIGTAGDTVAAPALTWSSSLPAAARVDPNGLVHGVGEGDVVIHARGGGIASNPRHVDIYPGPGWLDQSANLATVQNLHGVAFVNVREGWAVGDLGTVFHNTEAGVTWTQQASNSTGYTLNAVAFASAAHGVIVGSAGRVLTGGPAGWLPLSGVDTDNLKALNAVYFQDAQRGWIVGNAGLILRTTNGGATWKRIVPTSTTVDLEAVWFPRWTGGGTPPAEPYGRGWAVGGAGTILGSTDFGQTWHVAAAFNDHL